MLSRRSRKYPTRGRVQQIDKATANLKSIFQNFENFFEEDWDDKELKNKALCYLEEELKKFDILDKESLIKHNVASMLKNLLTGEVESEKGKTEDAAKEEIETGKEVEMESEQEETALEPNEMEEPEEQTALEISMTSSQLEEALRKVLSELEESIVCLGTPVRSIEVVTLGDTPIQVITLEDTPKKNQGDTTSPTQFPLKAKSPVYDKRHSVPMEMSSPQSPWDSHA